MRTKPYISFFVFTDSRDRLISQPVLSATEDGFILFIVQIDFIDNLTGSYPDVIVRVDCEAVVAVLFAAGKYRCELLRVEIHLDTSPLGQEYQVFIFPYLHLVDTVACHYCIRRSFKIRVSESSAGNIENGQSAGVRTDIQLVAFGAVGYIFQVVVCDGVLVRVGQ